MKLQITVADERAGQQAGLGQHLKTIAHAQHQPAIVGELFHRLHHRAEPRDGAAPEVVAVAEAAGHDDRICIAEGIILVPDVARGVAEQPDGMDGVLVAIRGGELKNSKIHTRMEDGGLKMAKDFGRLMPSSIFHLLSSLFIQFRGGSPQ